MRHGPRGPTPPAPRSLRQPPLPLPSQPYTWEPGLLSPDLRLWLCFLANVLVSSLQSSDPTNGPLGNTPAGLTQLSSRSHQSVLSVDTVLAPARCRMPGTQKGQKAVYALDEVDKEKP